MLADPTFWAFVGLVLFFVVIFFAGVPAAMILIAGSRRPS